MTEIPLLGGAYEARSIIADAQKCVNLFLENNPKGAETPTTHYPTPGLVALNTQLVGGPVRGLYTATNGDLFAAIGSKLYFVNSSWNLVFLANFVDTGRTTPVSMVDSGTWLLAVDGSVNGIKVELSTHNTFLVADSNFMGGDRVDFMDTYFVLNVPGSQQFYCSLSDELVFDGLYYASKTGAGDSVVGVICKHRELWVLGTRTTEIWYNAGGAAFPFAELPGSFVEHGCVAKYSIAKQDLSNYWLGIDQQGHGIVFVGQGYAAKRISTHALENSIQAYPRIDDAIGFCYQQQGHVFYVLTFPTADVTWVFDAATEQWHQRAWMDSNGQLHRHRANCVAFAYGKVVVGDWQYGYLYEWDMDTYTDVGDPILRVRGFPHLVNDGKRVHYTSFIANMQVGEYSTEQPPEIALRWSDDRGKTWGTPVTQSMGEIGEYLTTITWRRLGMARDRVFELAWTAPIRTALNSAYIDNIPAQT